MRYVDPFDINQNKITKSLHFFTLQFIFWQDGHPDRPTFTFDGWMSYVSQFFLSVLDQFIRAKKQSAVFPKIFFKIIRG